MKLRTVALVLVCCFAAAPAARAQSAAEIDAAINKGKEWLYKQQKADGTWESSPQPEAAAKGGGQDLDAGQHGGRTALAVYALLVSGEKPSDPRLKKAIDFLQKQTAAGVYVLAVKCQVWLNLPETPEVKAAIRRDSNLIKTMAKLTGQGLPVWDYIATKTKSYSLSRAQYAALGMWAASEMNVESPPDFWRAVERTWETAQTPEGGWQYMIPADIKADDLKHTTLSMTASALATLYIAQDFTKSDLYSNPRGNPVTPSIDKGIKWLTENFDKHIAGAKPLPEREFPFPQLYSIERTGLASGLRRFGPHDWYARGAAFLLQRQNKDGGWGGTQDGNIGNPIVNASFAMLFLQRGRTPVAFNKLDYTTGVTGDAKKAFWNQRPRDMANVTRWLSRSLERELRWQIVAADSEPAALLESPLLYISGGNDVDFTPELKAKLKAYVQSGGMIVAHADAGNAGFGKSIMDLGKELFAPNDWRELPDNHPIYVNQTFRREAMKTKPQVRGISNGVRELIVLMHTGDPAKNWQMRNANTKPEVWQLAGNFLSYVTDKSNFFPRGTTWLASPTTAKTTKTVTVGRLKHNGNWDPEPVAWAQEALYARAQKGIDLKTEVVEAGKPIPASIKLLHVTGTSNLQLDETARAAIKTYVAAGGTVFFEAAGGSPEFGGSAEAELAKMFGAENLKALPSTHAIYGTDLKVSFRAFNIMTIANPLAPQLRGVEEGGRVRAILSKEDLTAGLLGIPTDGIVGYTPEAARSLMTQVLNSLK